MTSDFFPADRAGALVSLPSFNLEAVLAVSIFDPVLACVASFGPEGIVGVLLALASVEVVRPLGGRLSGAGGALVPGVERSRVESIGGLRVKVDGFLGGGSFEVDVGRGFLGDFGPSFVGDLGTSAGLGFKDGIWDRSLPFSLASMSSFGGCLEEDAGRGFSGDLGANLVDLGPSAELGLEDEVEDGALDLPVEGISK